MITVFEVAGLLAAAYALWVSGRAGFAIRRQAKGPLLALLGLLMFDHLANILEWNGWGMADNIADGLAGTKPLLWALFLLEVSRSYLSARVSADAERLAFLLEKVPAAIAWIGSAGEIVAHSRAWQDAFPATEQGRALKTVLPTEIPALTEGLARCMGGASTDENGEVELMSPGTRPRTFVWAARRFVHPDEKLAGALLLVEETTTQVQAEIERLVAAEDLSRAQRAADLGHLAAGAAHDFNNLLLVIQVATEELSAVPSADRAVEDIRRAVTSATAMTKAMLQFGRTRSQERVPLDLCVLVGQVEGLLRLGLGRRHNLEVQRPATPVRIVGNASRLEQAILNLVVNARDASPHGGTIRLVLETRTDGAHLTVQDHGEGMSDSVQNQLFTPFFTTKGVRGTGMGLSIVQHAVSEHGGSISVESAPGAGSTFHLRLPLAPDAGH